MFKTALFDCVINEKCCSDDGGRGICPLFSSPARLIWQLKSPHPREFAIQVACSKRSDSGERCEVKKAMKSRGGLGRGDRSLRLNGFHAETLD